MEEVVRMKIKNNLFSLIPDKLAGIQSYVVEYGFSCNFPSAGRG